MILAARALGLKTIPEPPIDRIRTGAAADIDLLVGSNTEETRLFLLPDGSIDRITEEAVSAIATGYGLPPGSLSAYRAAHLGASTGELFSAIQTDWYWRIPAVRMGRRPCDDGPGLNVYV